MPASTTTGTVACWIIISAWHGFPVPDSSQSARRAASRCTADFFQTFTQYRIGPAVRSTTNPCCTSVSAAFRVSMGSATASGRQGESLILASLCLMLTCQMGGENGFFRCFRPGCIGSRVTPAAISGSRIASLCWRSRHVSSPASPVGCRKRE